MYHFPVPYINPHMGDGVCRGIGPCEENQIPRLHVFFGNRGTQVIQPLRGLPAHIPHAGMVDHPGHITGAVKRGGRGRATPHIRVADIVKSQLF